MTSVSKPGGITITTIWNNNIYSGFPFDQIARKYLGWADQRIGVDNPHWRDLVQQHKNATNPMTAQRYTIDYSPCFFSGHLIVWKDALHTKRESQGTDVITGWPTPYTGPTLPDTAHIPSVYSVALGRFTNRLSSELSPVSGLVFLGEIMETKRMIGNAVRRLLTDVSKYGRSAKKIARRIKKILKRPSKLREVSLRRETKKLADLWLEYSFGWSPLVADIQAGLDTLMVPKSKYIRIKGFAEDQTTTISTIGVSLGGLNAWTTQMSNRSKKKTTVRITGLIDISLNSNEAATLEERFTPERWGLTMRKFVPSVWNLIPNSFLVDYFSNVGTMIEAAFAEERRVAWICATSRTIGHRDYGWTSPRFTPEPSSDAGSYFSFMPPQFDGIGKRVDRVIPPTLVPSLVLSYPPMGSTRWANMAALILGRIRV